MGSEVPSGGKFVRTASAASSGKLQGDERKRYENNIRELGEANENWQKHNNKREVHIKQLAEEVRSKDQQISDLQKTVDETEKQRKASEESRKQLEKDNKLLNSQLQSAKEEIQELRRWNGESANSSELLHLRDEQVKAYKEDFESERRDRERAQSRLADVEMELEIVKRELRQYNLREMQNLHQKRQAALDFHRQDYLRKNPQSVYQTDHFDERDPEEGQDEID